LVGTDLTVACGRVGSDAMEPRPIRILLVDDDAAFLNSLEVLLTGEPRLEIVGKAASGEEALAAAARAEPDVAVIDVLMPKMSGIECAQLLQERHPKARVILISGSIFEDKRPQPDERGTDTYLEKSEVPERLHAKILALAADITGAPAGRTNA
jgi:NarL family two-component system response regulator LiaR